jgi:hypothetical protein
MPAAQPTASQYIAKARSIGPDHRPQIVLQATVPPPTPLFAGRPTRWAKLPTESYMPQVNSKALTRLARRGGWITSLTSRQVLTTAHDGSNTRRSEMVVVTRGGLKC